MRIENLPERREHPGLSERLSRLAGRPVRFVLAGALNTAVGFAAYPVLLWSSDWLQQHYLLALLLVQVFCVCFAFTTYKVGVFQSRGRLVGDFIRFASYYVTIFAVNWVVLPFFVEVVGINPIITQTVFNFFVVVLGYFWHSNITFKSEENVECSKIDTAAQSDMAAEQVSGGQL